VRVQGALKSGQWCCAGFLVFAVACGSESTGPSPGSLAVTAFTTGADLDPDGYTVAIDGAAGQPLPVNGTATFSELRPGSHSVAVSDIAANCAVTGQNPATVTATSAATVQAAFQILCTRIAKILFESDRDPAGLYLINPDGSNSVALNLFGYEPRWSPDYMRIAFASPGAPDIGINFLVIANADGSNPRVITSPFSGAVQNAYSPSWSPDGLRIAFECNLLAICVVDTTGTQLVRLTADSGYDFQPAWSPDGAKIAFTTERDRNDEIYVMNADGTGLVDLTNNPAYDESAAWSPDGSKIAFDSDRDGNFEVYVMNADGTGVNRLTFDPAGDKAPSWSPDGSRIAFMTHRDGQWEVYTMRVGDGSGLVNISNYPGFDGAPAWWR